MPLEESHLRFRITRLADKRMRADGQELVHKEEGFTMGEQLLQRTWPRLAIRYERDAIVDS
jgi:hypothetical protein